MALCEVKSAWASASLDHSRRYQVLSQFYENATVRLQDLECPFGAAFVARCEHIVLSPPILHSCLGVQRCPVASRSVSLGSLTSPR